MHGNQSFIGALTVLLLIAGLGSGPLAADPPEDCCMECSPFGDGYDGTVVIDHNTTLSGHRYYQNLTVESGVTLDTHGYTLRVCGTLINHGTITDSYSGGPGGDGGNGGLGGDPCDNTPGKPTNPTDGDCGDPGEPPLAPLAGYGGDGGDGGGGGGGAKRDGDLILCTDADGGDGGDGSDGGKGGGYVRIFAYRLENYGLIHADGENGDAGEPGENGEYYLWYSIIWHDLAGGGGGGGCGGDGGDGGTVEIHYNQLTNSGQIRADGGLGGGSAAGGSGHGLDYGVLAQYGSYQYGADGCGCGGDGGRGEWRDNHSSEDGDDSGNSQNGEVGDVVYTPTACDTPVITVCPDGSGDYTTIADALAAAADGYIIELCDAEYTGSGNWNISFPDICVTIRSASGDPRACFINGGGSHRAFSIVDMERAPYFEGIGFCNCGPMIVPSNGGAIYAPNESPTFRWCTFTGNRATNGGAIYGDAVLEHCTVTANYAVDTGGGLYGQCSPHHSIIRGNESGVIADDWWADGGGVPVNCCNVVGDWGGFDTLLIHCLLGDDIDADPQFCDPQPADDAPICAGDYRLSSESPCVDAPDCGLIGALDVGCYPVGACCDEVLETCEDNVEQMDCVGPNMRFVANTLCIDLDPPCGEAEGACCYEDDTCAILTRRECMRRLGDMDCNGSVNFDDIDGFVTAMVSFNSYYAMHPDCNYYNGDMDDNGMVNFDDIDPFVEALVAGGYGETMATWLGVGTSCHQCNTVACPPETTHLEAEDCGDDVNGGCDMNTPAFEPLVCGDIVCGTAWSSDGQRDSDWYEIQHSAPLNVNWTVQAEFPVMVAILMGTCDDLELVDQDTAEPDVPVTVSGTVVGTVWLSVAPAASDLDLNCEPHGRDYVASLTCDPPGALPRISPAEFE